MAMERENRAPRGNSRKRRKVCQFCVDKCEHIDYKDAAKAAPLHQRALQDPAPPHHRHLRYASASADDGHQSGPGRSPCCPSSPNKAEIYAESNRRSLTAASAFF